MIRNGEDRRVWEPFRETSVLAVGEVTHEVKVKQIRFMLLNKILWIVALHLGVIMLQPRRMSYLQAQQVLCPVVGLKVCEIKGCCFTRSSQKDWNPHGYRLILDLLLGLCNMKNPRLALAVDILWFLFPHLLTFLFIVWKFIMWVVFHFHDELKYFNQIWLNCFTPSPSFLEPAGQYEIRFCFAIWILQIPEKRNRVYWWWKYWKCQSFWIGTIIDKVFIEKLYP